MTDIGPLMTLAIVLTAGMVGGEIGAKLKLPRVTGWIITGVLLGAVPLEILSAERVKSVAPLSHFVLGFIAFTVGSHLHLRSLINSGKRLSFLVLTEALITPVVVAMCMYWLGGLPLEAAVIFAAIAVAGAPGTTLLVVREGRARGVFVSTLMAAVALIDMVAVCVFVLLTENLEFEAFLSLGFAAKALPAVAKTFALGSAVGVGCALLVILLTRTIVGPRLLGTSLIASILMCWGVAELLDVSGILAVTILGVALANLIADKERAGEAYLNTFSSVLFTAFYVLAGMRLDFSQVLPLAGLVALFFVSRLAGKYLSAFTAMSFAQAPKRVRNFLGPALIPHGGVAVGLIIAVEADPYLTQYADTVVAVGLAALAINQFVGPSAVRWTLSHVGEAGHDRPRLLDFLREQDILIGFREKSREAAIRTMVDHLFKTHAVHSSKEEFLESVLDRDKLASTCLGKGLMIPHGRVDMGDEVAGVMAISAEGLDWDTPDGRPVHAVVLLATPTSQKNRHLEVLAAFAQAVGRNRQIREALYHADTAAHAYEILHAGDAVDFNYFLEDALADDENLGADPPESQAAAG